MSKTPTANKITETAETIVSNQQPIPPRNANVRTAEIWIRDERGLRCTYLGLRKIIREHHLPQDSVPDENDTQEADGEDEETPGADHLGRQPSQHAYTASISRGSTGSTRATNNDSPERSAGDDTADEAPTTTIEDAPQS